MSNFVEYFNDFSDFDFEITKRSGLNLEKINNKLNDLKCQKHILDISINGFSNNENFDFEIDSVKWSNLKNSFKKGVEAQKDPEALTVKRAIRLMANSTTKYIEKSDCKCPIQNFNPLLNKKYCHLGSHYIIDEKDANQLLLLWKNFDKKKKTHIYDTVYKILSLRFPNENLL